MNRRQHELSQVAVVFAAGILARIVLFDVVGVWGDFGFYIYNSRLILEGQTPFIDFVGRSPLFIYTYAWLRGVIGHPIPLLRSYVIFWWVMAGVPVYLIARQIADHRTGLVALVLYLLAPFSLAYGMWANTQSLAAFLAISGLYVLIKYESLRGYALVGVLFGLAFLSRRSVVVLFPAIVLWAGLRVYRSETNARGAVLSVAVLFSTAGITLLLAYFAIAGGDLARAFGLAEIHAVNLIASTGRGGYPLLEAGPVPPVQNQLNFGRIPIFNDICQLCGAWTARTFAKTLLVTAPVVGVLAVYFRDITDRYFTSAHMQYLFGILAVLGLYAAVRALIAGYHIRAVTAISLALFVVFAYRTERLDSATLYGHGNALLVIVLLGFAAGYLHRNRLLHTYYFMDFWPAVAILAGVVGVAAWRRADQPARYVLVGAMVLATVSSGAGAYPLTNILVDDNAGGWFTMDSVGEYQEDMDYRTDPGDVVLTATPTYVAGSEVRMLNDNARIHYIYATFYEKHGPTGPSIAVYNRIIEAMESGEITLIVVDELTQNMLVVNETVSNLFESNYCRVEEVDELYRDTGAFLYERNVDCEQPPDVEQLNNMTDESGAKAA